MLGIVIGTLTVAAAGLAIRAAARAGKFYIRCPMCGMEREYSKENAIGRVNRMTAREIAEQLAANLRCERRTTRHYANAPAEWVRDGGCEADLVWLYLQHPFIRGLFEKKARIDSAREFQKAHMDATEQEKTP